MSFHGYLNCIILFFGICLDAFKVEKIEESAYRSNFIDGNQFGELVCKNLWGHFETLDDINLGGNIPA